MTDTLDMPAVDFDRPDVELFGSLTDQSAAKFLHDLRDVPDGSDPLLISVTTPGGEAEMARRIVLELQRLRARTGRRLVFVGKTECYSAGMTIMSAFLVADRYLTNDCRLLIHSRQLEKALSISGPIRQSLAQIEALASQIRVGIQLEEEDFARIITDSDIAIDELMQKAPTNWYFSAQEALQRRLVAAIV